MGLYWEAMDPGMWRAQCRKWVFLISQDDEEGVSLYYTYQITPDGHNPLHGEEVCSNIIAAKTRALRLSRML